MELQSLRWNHCTVDAVTTFGATAISKDKTAIHQSYLGASALHLSVLYVVVELELEWKKEYFDRI